MLEVYLNEYIALVTPRIRYQLHHFSNVAMAVIHDVFPTDNEDDKDGISLKKFLKKEGDWSVIKNVLGFDFDGNPGEHTTCLTDDFRTYILVKSKKGIR